MAKSVVRPPASQRTGTPAEARSITPHDAREAAAVADPVSVRTKVRAKVLGIYGMQRRRPGDVFYVAAGTRLGSWMEIVPIETPLETKSAADIIRAKDAELRARKSPTYLQHNAADEALEPETPGPEEDIQL